MKFGRIEEEALSRMTWELPIDPPATQALLATLPSRPQAPSVYIGGSVWADRSFVGKLYPRGTPARNFLRLYCQQFNTVELNTTFYSLPSVDKVAKWKSEATPGFKFCPKVPRSISHSTRMEVQCRLLDTFIDAVLHFEASLGVTFWQLPPYFQPTGVGALQQLLMRIPQAFPLAIELRHPAWFHDVNAQQELFDFLRTRGISVVITDVAGRRDVLHQTLTNDCAFIRFTGNNLHVTDYLRIDRWVEKLCHWIHQGVSTIYFLLHEPEKVHSVDLADYMIRRLNARAGLRLAPPTLEQSLVTSQA